MIRVCLISKLTRLITPIRSWFRLFIFWYQTWLASPVSSSSKLRSDLVPFVSNWPRPREKLIDNAIYIFKTFIRLLASLCHLRFPRTRQFADLRLAFGPRFLAPRRCQASRHLCKKCCENWRKIVFCDWMTVLAMMAKNFNICQKRQNIEDNPTYL